MCKFEFNITVNFRENVNVFKSSLEFILHYTRPKSSAGTSSLRLVNCNMSNEEEVVRLTKKLDKMVSKKTTVSHMIFNL